MSTIDYTKLRAELIEELALSGLAPEKQDELLGRMLEALLKRIFMNTMERLGEEGMNEYEQLVENKATQEKDVADFLTKKIPDYDVFVNGIVDQFKKDIKAVAAQ
ncbi:hypothetical protein E6Q11_06360 [Candidatus Dojkabacteria bacterium]|uniref:Uncharacterized protein n=1 Tax=Candidatus Dojkabacteria bacterium TaxID=2099670 RepID=A0A5C7J3L0_9BACT|nr:MAG: hypothetical protein E6Q11_06360 [Candidatus Dojkabacteria bacterium]